MNLYLLKIPILLIGMLTNITQSQTALANQEPFTTQKRLSELQHIYVNNYLSLDIYVPPSTDSSKHYSTLYVMDGQHYIYQAIAYQKALVKGITNVNLSPEFIVVGINTKKMAQNKTRSRMLTRQANELLDIFEKQIIAFVDENYPTNKQKMYFGWQSGAVFGLQFFNKNPHLFNAYFLASGHNFTQNQQKQFQQILQNNPKLDSSFYLTLGQMEHHAFAAHETLVDILETYKGNNVKWFYSQSQRFQARSSHHTTPLESLSNGLQWYFSDYQDLTFYSVEDIVNFGGVVAIKNYYEKRAQRYQISKEVSEQTKFSIYRHAAQANNYDLFTEFEDELGLYEVNAWHRFFAKFFVNNNDFDRAETIYRAAIKKDPNAHQLWAELALVLEKTNKYESAMQAFATAAKLSIQDEKANQIYESDMKKLREKIKAKNN